MTLLVVVAPLLSVTVNEAVKEPAGYVCVGFALDDDVPSPKFQKYDAMNPSGSLADEAKLTKSGLTPEVGEAEMLKLGG